MNHLKKSLVRLAVPLSLAIPLLFTAASAKAATISANKYVTGDFTISDKFIFQKGAALFVSGNLTVTKEAELNCEKGFIYISVRGDLVDDGKIICNLDKEHDAVGSGISI